MPEIFLKNIAVPPNIIVCEIFLLEIFDLVKNVMCILGSMDCVLFSKDVKCHVYPENQGTHDKLDQIRNFCYRIRNKTKKDPSHPIHVHWFQNLVIINLWQQWIKRGRDSKRLG